MCSKEIRFDIFGKDADQKIDSLTANLAEVVGLEV
jgi:hypothetical protein